MAVGIFRTTDVRKMLGESSNDLSELCTSPKVKHWSKYKPLDMPALHYPDPEILWKGKAGQLVNIDNDTISTVCNYQPKGNVWWCYVCGIKFYVCSDPVDLANIIYRLEPEDEMYQDNFSWDKPRGGWGSPYRLADFRGYDHRSECMFWTNRATSPWLSDTNLPKYNLQVGADIVCSVNTWDWIYGMSLIGILEDGVGAWNVKLCIMDFDEGNAYSDKSALSNGTMIGNLKTIDFSTDVNIISAQTVIKPYEDYGDRRGVGNVLSLVYMIRFTLNGNTYYMPLTQGYDGGPNTDITPFGNKSYPVIRYMLAEQPPVVLNIEQYKKPDGAWIDAYDNPPELQTAQLRIKFIARTTEDDFRFDASKVRFRFVWNRPTTGEHGEHIIDGSAGYNSERMFVRVSTTDNGGDTPNIPVPKNENFSLFVSLPRLGDITQGESLPLQRNDIISQMTAEWRNNPSLPWEPITSFNLKIIIA